MTITRIQTLLRMNKSRTKFVGPFDSIRLYRECGVPETCCRLIHPGETVHLDDSTTAQATFALPTDSTDLNHTRILLRLRVGSRSTTQGTLLMPST
jgi:L-ascorbate 6-phosphate lactonase